MFLPLCPPVFFQLFPHLAKAVSLENSTIIVVSPLISIMRDQVEQLKKLGFSAAAIGIGEEGAEDPTRKCGKRSYSMGNLENRPRHWHWMKSTQSQNGWCDIFLSVFDFRIRGHLFKEQGILLFNGMQISGLVAQSRSPRALDALLKRSTQRETWEWLYLCGQTNKTKHHCQMLTQRTLTVLSLTSHAPGTQGANSVKNFFGPQLAKQKTKQLPDI